MINEREYSNCRGIWLMSLKEGSLPQLPALGRLGIFGSTTVALLLSVTLLLRLHPITKLSIAKGSIKI